MIQLTDLSIKNYRSIINTKFKLPENPVALIGVNGAGKTNILNALTTLKDALASPMRYTYYQPSADYEVPDEEERSTIEVYFADETNKKLGLKFELYFDLTKEGTPLSHFRAYFRYMNVKYSRWSTLDTNFFRFWEMRRRREQPVKFIPTYIKQRPNDEYIQMLTSCCSYIAGIDYYSATQFSDPSKCPVSLELRGGKLSRNYDRAISHERFLYEMFIHFQNDTSAKSRYMSVVGMSGLELIENIEFQEVDIPSSSVRVLAGGKIRTVDTKRTIVIPIFTVDGLTLSPSQLSEGTFKTLALTYYIMNSECSLLLIEEPEVCVHHGLLSSIVELIKFQAQDRQIIVSTHSEVVIDQLEPENILLVEKAGGATSIQALSKAMSVNDYKALKLYLQTNGNLGDYWRESGFNDD